MLEGVAGLLNMAMVTILYPLGIEMKLILRKKVCSYIVQQFLFQFSKALV